MAIVSVAGKQYLVEKGDVILTGKLSQKEGSSFDTEDLLSSSKVKLTVKGQKSGAKTRVLKFKKKKGYKRTYGSKPIFSVVEVS